MSCIRGREKINPRHRFDASALRCAEYGCCDDRREWGLSIVARNYGFDEKRLLDREALEAECLRALRTVPDYKSMEIVQVRASPRSRQDANWKIARIYPDVARKLLGWTQRELADASGVTVGTIRVFERGRGQPQTVTVHSVYTALENAGVEFTNGNEPGVKLKAKG
jgi:DNA-binding XRE family transcriptional regulator